MNSHYTTERNVQILISVLKANNNPLAELI